MTDDDRPEADPNAADYDAPRVTALLKRVFPTDTYNVLMDLTGSKLRLVSRWCKGESRVPPKLVAKLEAQDRLKSDFDRDLLDLLDRYSDAGMMRAVMRQSVLQLKSGEYLKIDEEL